MKNANPSFTAVRKATCPFCSYNCEFGVIFNDFGIQGIEYIPAGASEGRLCPRGSAAPLYLNHAQRLSMPRKKHAEVSWSRISKELKRIMHKPQEVAVTFDRNVTIEEHEHLMAFCRETGITTASSYLEPEQVFKRFVTPSLSLDLIRKAEVILVLGDPFSQSPMISKSIINWRMSDRRHRLIVLDSIGTATSVFAHDFLKVVPGSEPAIIFHLAQKYTKDEGSRRFGLSGERINAISSVLKKATSGVIIASTSFGHSYDAALLAESLAVLADYCGMPIIPLVEFFAYDGSQHFGAVMALIKQKEIKHLINFGELFPHFYPQVRNGLRSVNIFATSPLEQNDAITLPGALLLEKHGTLLSTFGQKTLTGSIPPASGARTVEEILALVVEKVPTKGSVGETLPYPVDAKVHLQWLEEKVLRPLKKKKKGVSGRLVGEKIAYNFMGMLEEAHVKVNPHDAAQTGIRPLEVLHLQTNYGKIDLPVRITPVVDRGIMVVPAETPEVRGLFGYDMINDIVNFTPTEVVVWRKG